MKQLAMNQNVNTGNYYVSSSKNTKK